ncbi:estradiol 17-beta-dehydrogenase 2, partial [Reticulomyxa filosa]
MSCATFNKKKRKVQMSSSFTRLFHVWKNSSLKQRLLFGLVFLAVIYKIFKKIYKKKEKKLSRKRKCILITGCDSGFGRAVALELDKLGYTVIATCLEEKNVLSLLNRDNNKESLSKNSYAYVMDVTKKEQIETVKSKVVSEVLKKKVLWAIINNAGVNITHNFEVMSNDIYFDVCLDVLLKGPLYVTKTFLPLFYGRRYISHPSNSFFSSLFPCSCGGRIVNISSCSANFPAPQMTGYSVFKKALSFWTHCLRMELSPLFHIWCSVVEPGGFQTALLANGQTWDASIQRSCPKDIAQAYNLSQQLSIIQTGF